MNRSSLFLRTLFLLLLVVLSSCDNGQLNIYKERQPAFRIPVVYDHFWVDSLHLCRVYKMGLKENLALGSQDTTEFFSTDLNKNAGEYFPFYIGRYLDSISAHPFREYDRPPIYEIGTFRDPDSTNFFIYIDTTREISGISPQLIMDSIAISSYPVFVYNLSGDTLNLRRGYGLPFYLEAFTSKKKWEVVEHPYFNFCGTGLSVIYLAPKQIAITSVPIYSSERRQKMRLSYGSPFSTTRKWGYSNVFFSHVN